MDSIEAKIKSEYQKYFNTNDWTIFKIGANYYLRNAAFLKKSDITTSNSIFQYDIKGKDKDLKLLFRNIQKRLALGIGCELLIKSYYLKMGFYIIKPKDTEEHSKIAYKRTELSESQIDNNMTFTFSKLIDGLNLLEKKKIGSKKRIRINKTINEALRIAKTFSLAQEFPFLGVK